MNELKLKSMISFFLQSIDLVVADSSLRNISAFSYSHLTRFTQINEMFEQIGLQKASTSRLNVINIHKSEFELKSIVYF
jgi:hypothetical protein